MHYNARYLQMWQRNEITNEQKNKTKIRFLAYAAVSAGAFVLIGMYLVNSLTKEIETQSIKKMEKEAADILDKVQRSDFKYTRTTEISHAMLKIQNNKSLVRVGCVAMGFAYGLAQFRMYLKDEADLIVN